MAYHRHDPTESAGYHANDSSEGISYHPGLEEDQKYQSSEYQSGMDDVYRSEGDQEDKKEDEEPSEFEQQIEDEQPKQKEEEEEDDLSIQKKAADEVARLPQEQDTPQIPKKKDTKSIEEAIEKAVTEEKEVVYLD